MATVSVFTQELEVTSGRTHRRLWVEWLPAYAPDLSPVEALWSHAKYTNLADFVRDDADHLHDAVIEAVGDPHFNQSLLQSFFHAAKLNL